MAGNHLRKYQAGKSLGASPIEGCFSGIENSFAADEEKEGLF
jgi:hypothetical protein